MRKEEAYDQLVRDRQACRRCTELQNPSAGDCGQFDSHHVGPWSCWNGSLSARLMIVGQDWGDVSYFLTNRGLDKASNPTNKMLADLLEHIGIKVAPVGQPPIADDVFMTNAILCLKKGGMQARVNPDWFIACSPFLRRQVEIVRPRVVVALGNHALRAIRQACGLTPRALKQSVADAEGETLLPGITLIAVYHCGARTLRINRPIEQQRRDWQRVRRILDRLIVNG